MSKIRFNPEVTLGHIIQMILITFMIAGAYASWRANEEKQNYRIALLEEVSKEHKKAVENLTRVTERMDERTKNAR